MVEAVLMAAPSWATSSAICSAERDEVPSSSIAAVKFARPGFCGGFAPLPVFTTRFADTTGRLPRDLANEDFPDQPGLAAADEGMRATVPLKARKGRASYLGERSIGHQDPGATSTALIIAALHESLAEE